MGFLIRDDGTPGRAVLAALPGPVLPRLEVAGDRDGSPATADSQEHIVLAKRPG